MNFHVVKCRYLVVSAASHYISVVFKHGVFFHTSSSNVWKALLELVKKNTTLGINTLKYSLAANKFKVFPLYRMKIHWELRRWWTLFLPVLSEISYKITAKSHWFSALRKWSCCVRDNVSSIISLWTFFFIGQEHVTPMWTLRCGPKSNLSETLCLYTNYQVS